MIRTASTYRKLDKVFSGTREECKDIIAAMFAFPKKDVVVCTRGNNDIAYYRPCNGEWINDKIWMMHYNGGGDNWSLFV